jgi:hypothetical protein
LNTPATFTPPGPGYLFTLAMACVGLPFMGIGLGGALIGSAGGDPMDAMNVDGFVLFILGYVVCFAMRLLFWSRTPPGLRRLVRFLICAIVAAEIPLALLGLVLAWRLPPTLHDADLAIWFSILAVLCQPLSVLWLARYRRDGL